MGWSPQTEVARLVYECGFIYDGGQDIIYSRNDAPIQRKGGYNRAYDELAAELSMIIDCEPFYFRYGGRMWLIELWKGQYCVETGCEIGLYRDDLSYVIRDEKDLPETSAAAKQRHYNCVGYSDWLTMSLTLYRKGAVLFKRGPEPHWWLTGFKWGVFTGNTLDLVMDFDIKFKDKEMRDSFIAAAERMFYKPRLTTGFGVALTFDHPHSMQPGSRKRRGDVQQLNNHNVVTLYNNYKAWCGYTDNDPNNFVKEDMPGHKLAQKLSKAGHKAGDNVHDKLHDKFPGLSKKIGDAVSKPFDNAAHKIDEWESMGSEKLYRRLFHNFEEKLWHTNNRPGQA